MLEGKYQEFYDRISQTIDKKISLQINYIRLPMEQMRHFIG